MALRSTFKLLWQQHHLYCEGRGYSNAGKTIWYAVLWAIWLQRNNIVFNNEQAQKKKVQDQIVLYSWLWLTIYYKDFKYSC